MSIQDALAKLIRRQNLSRDEMHAAMQEIMTGTATPAQIGGFLIALRMKGETVDEVVAAVEVMRSLSTKVSITGDRLVDTCGTGGDGSNLFNVSTAGAFVVASTGAQVAKHGNRGASSKTGSADLLEQAGVNLDLSPEQIQRSINELGIGFMFAQKHHAAMKHAIGPRRELGTRTIFNMLGPMTNPAGVENQVIGVFSKEVMGLMAQTLKALGSKHVLVLHSEDGLDEISIAAPTRICELKGGEICEYSINPEDFGIKPRSLDGLQVDNAEQSLELIKAALGKDRSELASKARDMIALNAGAAIYVAGVAKSMDEGVSMAQDAIGSGLALEKMGEMAAFTQVFAE